MGVIGWGIVGQISKLPPPLFYEILIPPPPTWWILFDLQNYINVILLLPFFQTKACLSMIFFNCYGTNA